MFADKSRIPLPQFLTGCDALKPAFDIDLTACEYL